MLADAAPSSPLIVVHNVNDTFVYTGSPAGGAAPETFTVAAGTYSTLTACIAAMAAVLSGTTGTGLLNQPLMGAEAKHRPM